MAAEGFGEGAVFGRGGERGWKHGFKQRKAEAGSESTENKTTIKEIVGKGIHGITWW